MGKERESGGGGGSGGIGFCGLLAIVFITLKLTGYINWSWLWVLSPLWIPAALVASAIAVVLGSAAVMFCLDAVVGRSRR